MKDGETRYACPKCGCSADSFISIGDSEATSRNSAPSAWRQNRGTSDNISNQPTKDYDVICPDCDSIISDENSDCPNCGCPSEMFIKQKKTQHAHYETLECPDCGKVFVETIPNECPNCGCPSDKFKQHIEINTPKKVNKSIIATLIILFIFIALGSGTDYIIRHQITEKMKQEQQAQREREEMRKKQEEERQAKEAYNALRIKWKDFSGTTYRASQFTSKGYQYYAFSYNSLGKGKYLIWWNYPGTNVVEEKMEFSIYKVESDANYLYLYTNELNTPVKIKIKGRSLYTSNGEERYEVW